MGSAVGKKMTRMDYLWAICRCTLISLSPSCCVYPQFAGLTSSSVQAHEEPIVLIQPGFPSVAHLQMWLLIPSPADHEAGLKLLRIVGGTPLPTTSVLRKTIVPADCPLGSYGNESAAAL